MRALNELNEQSQLDKANRYPSVPAFALPKSKFKDNTANGLTKAIIHWLTLNGCWATRVSSAGRYLPKQKKFIPSTTKKGTADIHAVIAGRHVSIEVKLGRDKMSDIQRKVQTEIEKSGGIFFIAKDFDSFITFYKTLKP